MTPKSACQDKALRTTSWLCGALVTLLPMSPPWGASDVSIQRLEFEDHNQQEGMGCRGLAVEEIWGLEGLRVVGSAAFT